MSLSTPMPVDVPTGWECPRCHRVYAPRVEQCLLCSPPTLFAGPLPRPEPRRFPHPAGGLTAETCCVCASTEVTYRNYAGLPFCKECADGEPLGNMATAAEAPRLTVLLPGYMASPAGRQHARLAGEWREVFPGLQARITDEGDVQADVEFRLAPQDDGRPDG
jgi:hypothetical protein